MPLIVNISAEAQIIAYVQKNQVKQDKLPDQLFNALSKHAKEYLGWSKE